MANEVDLQRVEEIIEYTFARRELLVQALTAAHRIDLEDARFESFENNKRLGVLGDAAIRIILAEDWLDTDQSISVLHDAQIQRISNFALGGIATRTGISSCIIRSGRQEYLSSLPLTTISMAVKAVVGAVWSDSQGNTAAVRRVLLRVGITD